jgi:hypothetical protein
VEIAVQAAATTQAKASAGGARRAFHTVSTVMLRSITSIVVNTPNLTEALKINAAG